MTTNLQTKKTLVIPKGNYLPYKNEITTSNNIPNSISINSNTYLSGKQSNLSKPKIPSKPIRKDNDENINTQNVFHIPKPSAKYEPKLSSRQAPTPTFHNSNANNSSNNYNSIGNSNIARNTRFQNTQEINHNNKSQSLERGDESQVITLNSTRHSITSLSSHNQSSFIPVSKNKEVKETRDTSRELTEYREKEGKDTTRETRETARKGKDTNRNSKEKSRNSFFTDLREKINNTTIEATVSINENDSLNHSNLQLNNNLSTDFNHSEYKRMESMFVRENHSQDILTTLLLEEKATPPSLTKHKINERMRMRMVDWMIEVISNYKCDESSFFLAIDLMDSYFELEKKTLDPNELHLIGVACMFTASKYQDIYPLRLKMVHEKIAHKKLSIEEIKSKEAEIVALRNFKLGSPTTWDFINMFIEEIFFTGENKFHLEADRLKEKVQAYDLVKQNYSKVFSNSTFCSSNLVQGSKMEKSSQTISKLYTPNMINLLKHVALYLAKMNLHDYSLITDTKHSLIAAGTIFVSLKICEQINKMEYLTDCFIKKLCILSSKPEQSIIKIAQKILSNAQNFDNVFSGLENLKKVHFNSIIELKNTK